MAKFFKCNLCGKVVGEVIQTNVPTFCCEKEMLELVANSSEASKEKHVPVVKKDKCEKCGCDCKITVEVGETLHPMENVHHIDFIYIETENGGQRKKLIGEPKANFCCCQDKPISVFAYCNTHGLFKTDIK